MLFIIIVHAKSNSTIHTSIIEWDHKNLATRFIA